MSRTARNRRAGSRGRDRPATSCTESRSGGWPAAPGRGLPPRPFAEPTAGSPPPGGTRGADRMAGPGGLRDRRASGRSGPTSGAGRPARPPSVGFRVGSGAAPSRAASRPARARHDAPRGRERRPRSKMGGTLDRCACRGAESISSFNGMSSERRSWSVTAATSVSLSRLQFKASAVPPTTPSVRSACSRSGRIAPAASAIACSRIRRDSFAHPPPRLFLRPATALRTTPNEHLALAEHLHLNAPRRPHRRRSLERAPVHPGGVRRRSTRRAGHRCHGQRSERSMPSDR